MNREEFQELLHGWCEQDDEEGKIIRDIKSNIDYVEKHLYSQYKPTSGASHPEFRSRLAKWIGSLESVEDQKNLFRLLRYLFFICSEEMEAAYLTAYSKNIAQWLVVCENISFFENDARTKLQDALMNTAYTELTDSFGIADFCHLNNIGGTGMRFTWNQHIDNWSDDRFIRRVLNNEEKKYLVIMEDFVGSGSQSMPLLNKACELPIDLKVLYCPIIICPEGAGIARDFENKCPHFTFSPVLELPEYHFLKDPGVSTEPDDYERIRNTLISNHAKVSGSSGINPFGYRDTGAIVVKHDNCPGNTLPVIHHQSDLDWNPLFRRVSREEA